MKKFILGLTLVLSICFAQTAVAQIAKNFSEDHFKGQFFLASLNMSTLLLSFIPYFLFYNPIPYAFIQKEQLIAKAFFFTILASIANFCYQKSLLYLVASISSAIQSSSPCIVYILSIILLRESITLLQGSALTLGIIGNLLLILTKHMGTSSNYYLGIFLALLCSLVSSIYKVCIVKFLGPPTVEKVLWFLGMIGLSQLITGSIFVSLLHFTDIEPLDVQYLSDHWPLVLAFMGSGFIFNYLLNVGIFITNPLYISIGYLMAIPCNLLVDRFFRTFTPTFLQFLGILLIVTSFLLMTLQLHLRAKTIQPAPLNDSQEKLIN